MNMRLQHGCGHTIPNYISTQTRTLLHQLHWESRNVRTIVFVWNHSSPNQFKSVRLKFKFVPLIVDVSSPWWLVANANQQRNLPGVSVGILPTSETDPYQARAKTWGGMCSISFLTPSRIVRKNFREKNESLGDQKLFPISLYAWQGSVLCFRDVGVNVDFSLLRR